MNLFSNARGMMFISLIMFLLLLIIFVFAAPALFTVITIGVASTGSATAFVIKLFPWVLLFMLVFWLLSRITGGGSFA